MNISHSPWMDVKDASEYIGYTNGDTLYKKVRAGELFADRSFGKNSTMFLRKDIEVIKKKRDKIIYRRPIIVRGKNVCSRCRKPFAGNELTYYKKQNLCRECLTADSCAPKLEDFAKFQSNMVAFDEADCYGDKVRPLGEGPTVMRDYKLEENSAT